MEAYVNLPFAATVGGTEIVHSARRIASSKDVLRSVAPVQLFARSVVGVGSMEQRSMLPSRLMTTGEQIVASPIDAWSRGTGTIYKAFNHVSGRLQVVIIVQLPSLRGWQSSPPVSVRGIS